MSLLGLFPIMIGMMMMLHAAAGGPSIPRARLREIGERLRRHYPVPRNDGAFDPLLDSLDRDGRA